MKKRAINIAVCSVVPHLGTTTTAFQIVGYLSLKGASIAYVDMTNSDYIDNLARLYAGVKKVNKLTRYEDINMYKTFTDVDEDYDYIVKDYGCMKDKNFNKTSFLEQDIKIVCCGIKPNEIFELTDILKSKDFDNSKFAFNFVPFDQRERILDSMGNRRNDSIFLSFSPDPFSYDGSNNKGFRQIIDNKYEAESGYKKSMIKRIIGFKERINVNFLIYINISIFFILIMSLIYLFGTR